MYSPKPGSKAFAPLGEAASWELPPYRMGLCQG